MPSLSRALLQGFASLLHPRMLALMLVPVTVALLLWLVAAVFFWGTAVDWIDLHIQQWNAVQWMLDWWPLSLFAAHAGTALLVLAAIPAVLVVATLVTGIFAMPMMVAHVANRDYPQLARRNGGSFVGSAWNGMAALLFFLLLAAVTLPLWLFPPLWPIISLGLLGYLNRRVFPYDALAEHADPVELARIVREDRGSFFWLGVAVALAAHIPIFGFFTPVYGGLVYIHYSLARLAALRGGPGRPVQPVPVQPLDGTAIDNDGRGLLG